MGRYFERNAGMAPMCGRIIGVLLVCDPPEQSAGELSAALGASKGSISTATRTLVAARLVRRVAVRSSRAAHFRIDDDGWVEAVAESLRSLSSILDVLGEGRALLSDAPPAQRARIDGVTGLYEWMQRELPARLDEYRRERGSAGRGDGS